MTELFFYIYIILILVFTGEKEVEEDRSKMLVINMGKNLVSVHRLSRGTLIIVYATNKDPSLCAPAVNYGISLLEKSKYFLFIFYFQFIFIIIIF